MQEQLIPALRPRYVALPEQMHEYFLEIRLRSTMDVVTVIELLSPANKRPGSDGRAEYLKKRDAVLMSPANLVEIDLLRGGARLPTSGPIPTADYYVIISRPDQRPRAEAFCRPMDVPLPTIPIPLSPDDAEVSLDLQAAFQTVYDRSGTISLTTRAL